jgi:hypothetical protein
METKRLIRAPGSRPRRVSGAPAHAGLASTPSTDQAGVMRERDASVAGWIARRR